MSFKLKPGINYCTNQEYHSDLEWLSSSKLKLILNDPMEFENQVIKGNTKSIKSGDLDTGSYVHSLTLEAHLIEKEFAFFKGWRKQGKDFEIFKNAPENQGKILLSMPQVENGKKYAGSITKCQVALKLLEGGEAELSICTTINGVQVKMRADKINVDGGYMLDIKTTRHASGREQFLWAMEDYDYALSAALYKMIAKEVFGKDFDFYFVVVSKADIVCNVYKLSTETFRRGQLDVLKAIDQYKKCKESGLWLLPESEQAKIDSEEILEV